MGCGCKKNKVVQTAAQPSNVKISFIESKPTQNPNLTVQQQQQVDKILEALNKLQTN